jgi:hypothetical protein
VVEAESSRGAQYNKGGWLGAVPQGILYIFFLVLMLLLCEYPEQMDSAAGAPLLQRRNVEVFDSDRAVIAGTSFPLINLFAMLTRGQDSGSTALSSGTSFIDT